SCNKQVFRQGLMQEALRAQLKRNCDIWASLGLLNLIHTIHSYSQFVRSSPQSLRLSPDINLGYATNLDRVDHLQSGQHSQFTFIRLPSGKNSISACFEPAI